MIDIRQPRWFAAYTKPRNEKKVLLRLQEEEIEAYLPLQTRIKQWSDRKKIVEEPVLRSYIFVRITEKDYHKVLNTFGIVRYVCFEGKAAPIPDSQIELLKRLMGEGLETEATEEEIVPGTRVEIRSGSLLGLEGEMVKHQGKRKVVVRLEGIANSFLITLPKRYITRAVSQ